MVAQQALGPKIQRRKAAIPWMKTRAGVSGLRDERTKLDSVEGSTIHQVKRAYRLASRFESCIDHNE
jgi:hypothetical protein